MILTLLISPSGIPGRFLDFLKAPNLMEPLSLVRQIKKNHLPRVRYYQLQSAHQLPNFRVQ